MQNMLYPGEYVRKGGGGGDNKFQLQKHGSLANIGVEQVQKIHSTVKIIINKNHACAEGHKRRWELSILYVPLCHKNCDSTAQV